MNSLDAESQLAEMGTGAPGSSKWVWVPAASAIAREAGAVLRAFFAKGVETEYKGDVDLVTVADRTSEQLIRERLAAAFPEHGIYGEEGTRDRLEGEFRWYVDPLDGTTNFAHGFPQFCVSLGLEQRPAGLAPEADGRLVAAVIYDPLRDELFTAERGGGARLNGRPLRVSRPRCWLSRYWRLAFPATSGTGIRISIFIMNLRCVRTVCGGRVRRRWIWHTWLRGAFMAFGSSTLIPGTRRRGFCWWRRPAGG